MPSGTHRAQRLRPLAHEEAQRLHSGYHTRMLPDHVPKPLRVLFVIDSLGTGGAEWDLAETLPMCRPHGIEPLVVALRPRIDGVQPALQAAGFDIRVLTAAGLGERVRALRAIIRSVRPDLVHTVLFHSDITGRLAAVGTGVPVVSRLVNTDYEPMQRPGGAMGALRHGVARWLDGFTARHLTDAVYGNSEAVRAAAVRDLGLRAERVAVVHGGRDASRLPLRTAAHRDAARAALGVAPDARVLLSVGRQDFQKAHTYLLDALGTVRAAHPQVQLIVAGRDGDQTALLRAQAERLGLAAHITWLGHRDDVPQLLAAADVFAFSSLYEGLPGAVIEAMAKGVPIVATDIAPTRELVTHEESALLVSPRDGAAMAVALDRVLRDDALSARLVETARGRFEAAFTLDDKVQRLVAYLRAVLR